MPPSRSSGYAARHASRRGASRAVSGLRSPLCTSVTAWLPSPPAPRVSPRSASTGSPAIDLTGQRQRAATVPRARCTAPTVTERNGVHRDRYFCRPHRLHCPMTRILPLLTCILVLALAPAAHAEWFQAEPVDGPADIDRVAIDIGREETAGLAYVKREPAGARAWLSVLAGGVWGAPGPISGPGASEVA